MGEIRTVEGTDGTCGTGRIPKYADNPETRKIVWDAAPKAVDKYGNKLIKIGLYWCSYDFNRFWQLVQEIDWADSIIIVRVADGKFYSRPKGYLLKCKKFMKHGMETGWYIFIDPLTQQVY